MKVCSISGCGRKVRALGWCDSHYQRHRRGLPVASPLRSYGTKDCSVAGCSRRHTAGGLCDPHWRQARKPRRWRQRTPAEVQQMRQLHAQGVSFEELARRFRMRCFYRSPDLQELELSLTAAGESVGAAGSAVRRCWPRRLRDREIDQIGGGDDDLLVDPLQFNGDRTVLVLVHAAQNSFDLTNVDSLVGVPSTAGLEFHTDSH